MSHHSQWNITLLLYNATLLNINIMKMNGFDESGRKNGRISIPNKIVHN